MEIDQNKRLKLEKTIHELQDRWGQKSVQRLRDYQQTVEVVSTGFEKLDQILGIGGLPCGRISEIRGRPSSGSTTLALKTAANFQLLGKSILFFDLDQAFDPEYAFRMGINLENLILVRPYDFDQAFQILVDIILSGSKNLILFDLSSASPGHSLQSMSRALDQLITPINRSGSLLLFLSSLPPRTHSASSDKYPHETYPNRVSESTTSSLKHYASVRLLLEKTDWLYQGQEIRGYRSHVQIQKNKLGPSEKHCDISIDIHHGDHFLKAGS